MLSPGIPAAHPLRVQARRFARQLVRHFIDDNVLNAGAMMAYYAVLALFPMLLFAVGLAMFVLSPTMIEQGVHMASAAVPPAVRDPLVGRITAFVQQPHGTFAFIGALLAIWGARGGLTSLMQALDVVFHKQETRSWLHRQLIAILFAVGGAVVAVLALALLIVGPIVGHWVARHTDVGFDVTLALSIGCWVCAGLLMMVVWALLYKFLPDTDAPLRLFTPGAAIGVTLWLAASIGFGVYIGRFNHYEAAYGALGGAIIFLTWLWLSNIALIVGAEIDAVLAELRGHDRPAAAPRTAHSAQSHGGEIPARA
jgi:membrane protein